jgi:type IV pilus assembly protein PilM
MTELIAKRLGVSHSQAHTIKIRYGMEPSKRQSEIIEAIAPVMDTLISEIRKTARYYHERAAGGEQIEQIIVLGGGADLPGMSAYITDQVRIPTRLCNPWQSISFGTLQAPHSLDTTLYTTAAGLSLASSEEVIT